jgi:hypothetical protein
MSVNYTIAIRLARTGIFVLPCSAETKAPRLPSWPTRATNIPNGVAYYWERYGRDSMPGIAMGKSGLVAVDIDVKNGIDGRAAFDLLLDQHEELPRCPATKSPSGGYHLIFRQPVGREPLGNATGALPPGIDIRGVGGQIIAPGAVRDTGEFYDSVAGWPDLAESYAAGTVPEIPAWLVAIIETKPAAALGGPSRDSLPRAGASDDKSAWAAAGLDAEAQALATTGPGAGAHGGRNNALYRLVATFAGHAAHGWTTREDVYAAAHRACEANGYLASREPSDGPKQFEKTFRSGWQWGYAHPTAGPRERLNTIDPNLTAGLKPRAA